MIRVSGSLEEANTESILEPDKPFVFIRPGSLFPVLFSSKAGIHSTESKRWVMGKACCSLFNMSSFCGKAEPPPSNISISKRRNMFAHLISLFPSLGSILLDFALFKCTYRRLYGMSRRRNTFQSIGSRSASRIQRDNILTSWIHVVQIHTYECNNLFTQRPRLVSSIKIQSLQTTSSSVFFHRIPVAFG